MTIGDRIKFLREQNNISQEELGRRLSITKQTIYKYENNIITNIPIDKVQAISNVFSVSPAYLMGWEEEPKESIPEGFDPMPEMAPVPLVGTIACGTPILAEQNIDEIVSLPAAWHATFSLKCKGDSMYPLIHDGDLVAIRQQKTIENGEIAAVRIDNEATLKRVYFSDGNMILQPVNPDFQPIVLVGEAINTIEIEGKAVGFCRGI